MPGKSLIKLVAILCLAPMLPASGVPAEERVRVYPAAKGEPISTMFSVTADGKDVPVYVAKVKSVASDNPITELAGVASFASFDMNAGVDVTVTYKEKVKSVTVLPLSRGIGAKITGNAVRFTVAKPDQLTVEINGDWNNSLHVFADPFETDAPNLKDPNLIYFGPGVHVIAPMKVDSGKTLYLAGGAVVYGQLPPGKSAPIFQLEGDNIKVRGHGIVDGSMIEWHHGNIFHVHGSNISIEGVVMRDSPGFTLRIDDSSAVKVGNVKLIGDRLNGDGVDIINSQHVDVSDSFVRVYDDLVVVKTSAKGMPASRDIQVSHMVLWNERAHPLSVGAEIREDIEEVRFSDCDVVRDKGHDWQLGVLSGDSGIVKHIVFEDIRMDEDRRPFGIFLGKTHWTKDPDVGQVEDIVFRNITSPKPEWDRPTQLIGEDAQHLVKGVVFDHVVLGGKPMKAGDVEQNAFVEDVVVKP